MTKRTLYKLLVLTFLCALWEAVARQNSAVNFIFPQPSKILTCCLLSYKLILFHCWHTLQSILGSFFLACFLAVCIASLMLIFPPLQQFFHPLFIFIQCTPMFALAPLIVLWAGWGIQAVIIPTTLTILFPLTITIYQGITSVPIEIKEQFTLLQASPLQTLTKLRLPYALPYIFSALKVAISSAGFATIAGEWVAAQQGLGILILESKRNYQMELAFAGLLTLSCLTLLLFHCIASWETWTFHMFRIHQTAPRKKKKILIWAPIASLCFCFLINPQKEYSSQTTDTPLIDIHLLLDWTPNVNHVPLYVGIEKQFFHNEGIRLHIHKNLETCSGISHLLFEQVDLTLYHYLGIIRASLKGFPIQITGRLIDASLQGFIYKDNEKIKTLQDLNGLHFGYCLGHTHDSNFLFQTLKTQGIYPNSMKNVSADLISPMLLGKVDFLYGAFYNIQGEKLKCLGVPTKTFLSNTYNLFTGPQLLLCGKKGTKATQPHIVQAMQRALQQSIAFCQKNLDHAFEIYCKAIKQNADNQQDEYKQWLATVPLLASSQQKLCPELTQTVLNNIKIRYPDLEGRAAHFHLDQLYTQEHIPC